MKTGELSKLTGVSRNTLSRLAGQGIIPAKRLPSVRAKWRFAQADLPAIRKTLVDAGLIEEPTRKK